MAHSSLKGHFKLKKLTRMLGIAEVHVVGHLDYLWWDAYGRKEVGSDGVLHGRTPDKIALVAEWYEDADKFVSALVDSGFLDRVGEQFAIHDYFDWAPQFVKQRVARQEKAGNAGEDTPTHTNTHTHDGARTCKTTDDHLRNVTEPNETKHKKTLSPPARGASAKPSSKKKAKTDPNPRTPRDDLWDVIVELWFKGAVLAKSHRTRIGKLVREFSELKASPDDVRARQAFVAGKWSKAAMATPEAVIKHWHAFGSEDPDGSDELSEELAAARRDDQEALEKRRAREAQEQRRA